MFHLRCQRPYGFSAPLLSLDQRSGLQGFYTVGFVDPVRDLRSTHGLSPSLAPQAIEPPNRPPQTKPRWCLSSFLEVSCPSAFPHTRQRPFCLSLPHSSACAFELSQPLDAFRHLASANHCFRLDPLLGLSPFRALFLSHSTRSCFQVGSPRAVGYQIPWLLTSRRPEQPSPLIPSTSGFSSIRKSASLAGGLDPQCARGSPGFSTLQGFALRLERLGSHPSVPPCASYIHRSKCTALRGFAPNQR